MTITLKNSSLDTYQKFHIDQRDQSDCGVTCLASLVNYFGGEVTIESLRDKSGTTVEGTTVLGLYQAAKKIGLEVQGFKAALDDLKSLEHPAILLVRINDRLDHFIILHEYKEGVFIIDDPADKVKILTPEELSEIWISKSLLLVKPTENLEQRSQIRNRKKEWLLGIIRDDIHLLAIATFLGMIISILGVSTAIFSQKLIDDILPTQNIERLILGMTLLSILLLSRSAIGYLRIKLLLRQSKDLNNRIIRLFYDALLFLPKSFFDTRKTGELITRMNDTGRIQRTISFVLGDIITQFLVALVSLIFVFVYSLPIGFALLGAVPIYVAVIIRFNKPIANKQREVMKAYALNESNYLDTIQGVEVIKNQNKEPIFSQSTTTVFGNLQEKTFNLGLLGGKYDLTTQITGVIAILSVLTYSSFQVFNGHLELGELVAILSMVGSLLPAVEAVVRSNMRIKEAKIAFDRMYEFASIDPEYKKEDSPPSISSIDTLSVENLKFRFPGRKPLLNSVDMSLEKGKIKCVLGESGSGKSTLIQILQKFYSPESGMIELDGRKWEEIHPKALRDVIGIVPQDTKIFNGSLLQNILLGESDVELEEVEQFMNQYGFDSMFRLFPQGYATLLGEEGVNISGGQKQLIALARALWKKPKLLLLDEATSALDRKTEQLVMELLQRLKKEMAILLVTHRITTAMQADYIYILENCTTSTHGTPSQLSMYSNFYSDFFHDLQLIPVEQTA